MSLYRDDLASEQRLAFGEELALGAERFEQTKDVAAAARAANTPLEAALAARVATEPPLRKARVERRFCERDLEDALRILNNDCRRADGGRIGPITEAVFPSGLAVAVAATGRAQLDEANAVRRRIDGVAHPELAAPKADMLARLDATIAPMQDAEDAYRKANGDWRVAFDEEVLRRNDHRRTMDKLIGLVRAAFPGDAGRRKVIVPDTGRRPKSDDTRDDGGDDLT